MALDPDIKIRYAIQIKGLETQGCIRTIGLTHFFSALAHTQQLVNPYPLKRETDTDSTDVEKMRTCGSELIEALLDQAVVVYVSRFLPSDSAILHADPQTTNMNFQEWASSNGLSISGITAADSGGHDVCATRFGLGIIGKCRFKNPALHAPLESLKFLATMPHAPSAGAACRLYPDRNKTCRGNVFRAVC
jgi:hypothetical protein